MWKNVIVAGFGNGQIRLYSAETGKLAAQVNAHARWVTALDVASDNGMVSLPWIVLINPIILWWEKKLTLAGIHQVLYHIVVSLHIQLLQFHWFETKCVDCVWPKKVCVSFDFSSIASSDQGTQSHLWHQSYFSTMYSFCNTSEIEIKIYFILV